jgi:2Fe-2S ferredoxin
MPTHKVTFEPGAVTVEVDPDSPPPGPGEVGCLLNAALDAGVDIEHACGGCGVCGTCHVIVEAGAENLSPADDAEMDVIQQVPGNTLDSRLACRAVVQGDVTVSVPEWNRNLAREQE